MAIYSVNERYQTIARFLLPVSVLSFLFLGFIRASNSNVHEIIDLTSAIWSYFYLLSLVLLIVFIYLCFSRWKTYWKPFVALMFPFVTIILLISIPFIDSARRLSIDTTESVFSNHLLPVHIFFTIIGELFFFLSFVGSILYLIMEWQLKKKASMRLIYKLPNLETIEKFNRWAILRSLVLLSIGLVFGVSMAVTNFDLLFLGTAKEIHIYFSWFIILGIFFIRRMKKLASHKVNMINAVLFLFIMFLFVFTNIYITEGFHSFQ
jgi:ABC-type uncharacterized transport system permease subunit